MNKKFKKGLALVLALVMVFATTASVFAADNGVNVTIKMDGGETYPTTTVTATDIANYAKGTGHLYDVTGAPSNVPSIGYTAADALIAAWMQINKLDAVPNDEIATGWDTHSEHPGLFFSTYAGLGSNEGHYYLIQSYEKDGKTMYDYYWRGYTWNLYINGSTTPAQYYATEYAVSNTSAVDFDYALTRSEDFTTDYYIPGCLNVSEDPYN